MTEQNNFDVEEDLDDFYDYYEVSPLGKWFATLGAVLLIALVLGAGYFATR